MRISDWSSDVCSSDLQFMADQVKFLPRQAEAVDIVVGLAVRVRQDDLGRHLLDNAVSDRRSERVRRTLRAEHEEGVELAVGFQAVLRDLLNTYVLQRSPHFIDVEHERPQIGRANV